MSALPIVAFITQRSWNSPMRTGKNRRQASKLSYQKSRIFRVEYKEENPNTKEWPDTRNTNQPLNQELRLID